MNPQNPILIIKAATLALPELVLSSSTTAQLHHGQLKIVASSFYDVQPRIERGLFKVAGKSSSMVPVADYELCELGAPRAFPLS